MSKVDFKKTLQSYKAKKDKFKILDIPPLNYLMIDGHGEPGGNQFAAAIETMYPVAYTLKFISKSETGKDYVVPPLEGLWWAEDFEWFTTKRDATKWDWTLMIMTPDWLGSEMFEIAKEKVAKKNLPAIENIRLEELKEGKVVQVLHIGSYSNEGPILEKMHSEFIPNNGLKMVGKHHEIYLSDARRVDQSKLRTILRQPVAEA